MLQKIREGSQGWVAKVIVGAIIVTFALFGAESLVSYFQSGSNDVAKVNGEAISRQAVETQVQRGIRSGQVPPEQERQYRAQVLDQLISQKTLDQYAEAGGLFVSDTQLDQIIVSLPEFQDQQGRFSDQLFTTRLAQAGYTPAAFRRELRADTLRRQIQQGLAVSAFVLPGEQQRLAALQQQQRSFRYARLTPDDLAEPVTPGDAEIQQYYEAHQDDFRRPEQVKVNYLVLNQQDLAHNVEVTDAELRQAYEQDRKAAPRRVSHILVTYGDGDRTEQQARARLEEVKAKLDKGEDFAKLAKTYSDDSSSAAKGGDIGVIQKGFFGEAFDDAAFALDQGQVSQIVKSDYGLHLIKVTDIEIPSFEKDRAALVKEVQLAQSQDAFNEAVQKLTNDAYEADDLASVAKDMGLPLKSSDWFSRDGGGEGVLSNPDVIAAAFSPDVLEDGYNSEAIETDAQQRVVLRVVDHRDASVLPLDQVRDRVTAAVKAEMTRQRLKAQAEQAVASLKQGETVSGLNWQRVDAVTRDGADGVPQPVLEAAFGLPRPAAEGASYTSVELPDAVAIVALDKVMAGKPDAQSADFTRRLAQRIKAQNAIQGLSESLQSEAKIEKQ